MESETSNHGISKKYFVVNENGAFLLFSHSCRFSFQSHSLCIKISG